VKPGIYIRNIWRAVRGRTEDFKGTEVHRLLLDWIGSNKSADDEVRGGARQLRARARELCRNEGYAKQYLRLLTTNVLGSTGIHLQSRVHGRGGELDQEANTAIESAWRSWANRPVTTDGRHNLRQFAKLQLKTLAREGEAIIRLYRGFPDNRFGLALQGIDPDLLDESFNRRRAGTTRDVRMGVEVDELDRPVGYWFLQRHESLTMGAPAARYFVPADEILHIYDPDRVNQTRGVSWLHATMVPMKMLGGYEEAELVAARTAAAKMGFFTKAEGVGGFGSDSKSPLEMDASPGTLEELPPGYQFTPWDPDHPTTAFSDFVKAVLRKISSALGVSYTSLTSDLEGANYSSMRSGLLLERDWWKEIQADWIDSFQWPVYREWLNMALLTGELRLGSRVAGDYTEQVVWQPRGWPWVDPAKEVTAAEKGIKIGITSRRKIAGERGADVEEIFEDLASEARLAGEMGIDVSPASSPAAPPQDDDDDEDGAATAGRGVVAGRIR
jgi:lambda family phage portal protein